MAETKTLRVRPGAASAVLHPQTGVHVVPDPSVPYGTDDPLVRAYPWLFGTEEEIAGVLSEPAVESVPIETATRAPGQKRPGRRAR